jgi:hypothetical protein
MDQTHPQCLLRSPVAREVADSMEVLFGIAGANAGVVRKEETYENLINRSGHRHRFPGDIFRFNHGTNLVKAVQEAPPTLF